MRKAVFIGGCPRSGTTLLASMLGVGADAIVTPESAFKFRFLADNSSDLFSGIWVANEPDRKIYPQLGTWMPTIGRAQPNGESVADGVSQMLQLVDLYAVAKGRANWSYWIDHTPANLANFHLLRDRFPGARFIHIVRDARAVVASLLKVRWGPSSAVYGAQFWCEKVAFGLAAEVAAPNDLLRVRYEDLVSHPSGELRRVSDFVGVTYDPCMINGTGFDPPGHWAEQHSLIGSTPQAARIDMWRNNLSSREIGIVEAIAGDLCRSLGYRVDRNSQEEPTGVELLLASVKEASSCIRTGLAKRLPIRSQILKHTR